jgi:hypothetical protein
MGREVSLQEVLLLPFSTAECDFGPIVEHRPGHLTLRYDAEGEEGILWTVLEFSMVLAARFTPDVACEPWMVEAYSRVCEAEGAAWIEQLRSIAAGRGMPLPGTARHFVIYFDHVGCWEVLADDVELEAPADRST